MDVYTTSFCLPHRAAQDELANEAPSFELPRDVVAAAAAANNSQQPRHTATAPSSSGHHHHQHHASYSVSSLSSSSSSSGLPQQNISRHQPSRSVSYSRPVSIPEDREEGSNILGESVSSSSTGGSRSGGGYVSSSNYDVGASSSRGSNGTSTVGAGSNGLAARRSTSSIASLGQGTTTTASSNAGDNVSTAPSSHAGHGSVPFPTATNGNTGVSSVPPPPSSRHGYGEDNGVAENAAAVAALAASQQRANAEIAEAIQKLCIEAMSNFQCMVQSTPLDGSRGKAYNFILSGGYQQVMGARGFILRASPFRKKSIVKVPRSEVLDAKELVKPEMKKKLDEIAALTRAHLAIVGQVSGTIGFGLETERNVEIVITGSYESVEQARVRLLVLLDELVSRHYVVSGPSATGYKQSPLNS